MQDHIAEGAVKAQKIAEYPKSCQITQNIPISAPVQADPTLNCLDQSWSVVLNTIQQCCVKHYTECCVKHYRECCVKYYTECCVKNYTECFVKYYTECCVKYYAACCVKHFIQYSVVEALVLI